MSATDPAPSVRRPGIAVAVIVAAAFLSLAFGLGLRAIAGGISARTLEEGITVTGSARANVTSDRAVWRIFANDQAPDIGSAIERTNMAIDTVTAYLVSNGIDEADISLGGLSTNVNYEYVDGNWTANISSYSAYRDLTVRSDDVVLIDRLSRGIGSILEGGISVSSAAPEYYITLLPELRPQLLEQAVADALDRAEAMVGVTGGSVGGARLVRSGPFQVSAPDSVDVSDAGLYDTSTIEKTVTATVTVTFSTSR